MYIHIQADPLQNVMPPQVHIQEHGDGVVDGRGEGDGLDALQRVRDVCERVCVCVGVKVYHTRGLNRTTATLRVHKVSSLSPKVCL